MKNSILIFLFLVLFFTQSALAQKVSVQGQGSVTYEGRLDPDERRQALTRAKLSALETYFSEQPTLLKFFNLRRAEITAKIDDYVLSSVVLDENEDRDSRIFSLVIRADISAARLRADLEGSSATSRLPTNERTPVVMIFMAREQTETQRFDDRVFKRADTRVEARTSDGTSERSEESESISSSGISSSGTAERSRVGVAETSISTTTGGSVTSKVEAVKWRVSRADVFDNAISSTLSSAGFEVVPADSIPGSQLDLDRVRSDFSNDPDLSPAVFQATVAGVKAADVQVLGIGTMDVGMRDTDPATGLVRVYVTITGRILDISGRFPRVVTSLTPIQFKGLGKDESTAKTNALTLAADKASKDIVDALNARQFR